MTSMKAYNKLVQFFPTTIHFIKDTVRLNTGCQNPVLYIEKTVQGPVYGNCLKYSRWLTYKKHFRIPGFIAFKPPIVLKASIIFLLNF